MAALSTQEKLAILADAAKYDASCASSGGKRAGGAKTGIGSVDGMGICHSYAPDGRCISLLKLLLTNHCVYDCLFCVNRASSPVRRARFTPEEVVDITLGFYRRNYIEGLFLSSGVIRSPDYTMEQVTRVAKLLREEHGFRGYIHLKTIPDADPKLIEEAGRYADRLSINIELPRETSFAKLAPQKNPGSIRKAMGRLRLRLDEAAEDKSRVRRPFAPAGQSTQMVIGADEARDSEIIGASVSLYSGYRLKRVYYSAFSPIPGAGDALPSQRPPLMREHRLYQADWLYRFYGFTLDDIVAATDEGMLDLAVDPKTSWALKHRDRFPLDVNRADRESLLRVPGLGVKGVDRILSSRRHGRLRLDDLRRLTRSLRQMTPFVTTPDWRPTAVLDDRRLAARMRAPALQLSLL